MTILESDPFMDYIKEVFFTSIEPAMNRPSNSVNKDALGQFEESLRGITNWAARCVDERLDNALRDPNNVEAIS